MLPSNKQEFLRKLKSFEGLHIAGCKIDYSKFESQSKWRYLGRVLEFEIGITRQFVYQHCPSQTTTKSRYKFIFISETWELYKGKELVYADKDYKQYEDPAPHAKLFKDTQLVSVDINKDWSEATFVFGNEFTLIARRCYKNVIGSAFFTLIQETEPYRKLMHFDAPDFIAYSNESTQYIVTPRKNRAKVLEGMPHQSKGSVSSLLSMKT